MFNVDDKTYFVFGDTLGYRKPGLTGGGGDDWRSNVMAISNDSNPSDGITFDGFIADAANHTGELSVVWSPYLSRWIMTYLHGGGNIVIREGINPWGPWGEPTGPHAGR